METRRWCKSCRCKVGTYSTYLGTTSIILTPSTEVDHDRACGISPISLRIIQSGSGQEKKKLHY